MGPGRDPDIRHTERQSERQRGRSQGEASILNASTCDPPPPQERDCLIQPKDFASPGDESVILELFIVN